MQYLKFVVGEGGGRGGAGRPGVVVRWTLAVGGGDGMDEGSDGRP